MKLIKAYIRILMVDEVIHALEKIDITRISVIDVREMGRSIDRHHFKYSMEYATTYTPVVKIEMVCKDEEVDKIVKVVKENAHTGRKGDGIIFVSPVEEAFHIRTGKKGKKFL
ncbi:MAG: hypothetical protein AMJ92_03380 [candidate division Zixibacteria bacterium SM23_81]|nr:MAG: hypothetical protein AMJ92_03380 [candidate division Zixibacteria bacterium SM23_81]